MVMIVIAIFIVIRIKKQKHILRAAQIWWTNGAKRWNNLNISDIHSFGCFFFTLCTVYIYICIEVVLHLRNTNEKKKHKRAAFRECCANNFVSIHQISNFNRHTNTPSLIFLTSIHKQKNSDSKSFHVTWLQLTAGEWKVRLSVWPWTQLYEPKTFW